MCSKKRLLYSVSFVTYLTLACIHGYDTVYGTPEECVYLSSGLRTYFYANRCYTIHLDTCTWYECGKKCEHREGRLAKVDNENLLHVLSGHKEGDSENTASFWTDGNEASRWIGAHATNPGSHDFVWTDGSPVRSEIEETPWLFAVLSVVKIAAECLVLGENDYQPVRQKKACTSEYQYICEYDVDSQTKVTAGIRQRSTLTTNPPAVLTREQLTTAAPKTAEPTELLPVSDRTADRGEVKMTAAASSTTAVLSTGNVVPTTGKREAIAPQRQGVFTHSKDHIGKFMTAEHMMSYQDYSMLECTAECSQVVCAVFSYNMLDKTCRLFSDFSVLNEETQSVKGWTSWFATYKTL